MGRPLRMCAVCRKRATKDVLLRVVSRERELCVDVRQQMPGRGVYFHARRECVLGRLKPRLFKAALRMSDLPSQKALTDIENELLAAICVREVERQKADFKER
ncbi:MAG: YlxR family protein [Candidatus Dadabacteria bacterium]|nr:MAG: YlxR family protein [Candidatus Dadabacteria bacterium]